MGVSQWGLLFLLTLQSFALAQNVEDIEFVHVVFMNHLDVGFDDYAINVVNKYFDVYFPRAINTSQQLRLKGGEVQFIYTTHAWLVSLYVDCDKVDFPYVPAIGERLHCPTPSQLTAFNEAVQRGDITWHAFPFNGEAEVADADLYTFGLQLSQGLKKRFNQAPVKTMSQRDVPGTTRSSIPVLVKNGIRALTVGVNGASAPPALPSAFVWRDPLSQTQILAMWHPGGYGGIALSDCVIVPGLSHALAFAFRGDNAGPPLVQEVEDDFATLRKEFPRAKIMASTYDSFVEALETVADRLPLVQDEVGDTWIYGVPSDPLKVAQFRGVLRARQACHQHKKCQQEDPLLFSFDRMLIKVIEHTWGMDVKTFLHDWANWSNSLFDKVRSASNYRDMVASWVEQRQFLYAARDTLADHPLGALIDQEWKALRPRRPETEGYAPVPPHSLTICGDVTLGLDPQSGGITTLKTGQLEWASPSHPLAQFRYTTFSEQDYRTFLSEYMYCSDCPWAPLDFGKKEVGAAHPHHQQVLSQIKSTWFKREASGTCSWLQEGVMSPSLVTNYGAPEVVWTQIQVEEGDISLSFQWFNKTSTRLPEALWLSFDPPPGGEWHIDKMGEWISPQDVVKNGSRHLHGVGQGVKYHKDGHTLLFQSVDAAVVSVGHLQPFPTPFTLANTTSGMHFNLYNNIWGTNYIMWYPYLDEDVSSLFRFKLLFQK